jgi:hypothetical protein
MLLSASAATIMVMAFRFLQNTRSRWIIWLGSRKSCRVPHPEQRKDQASNADRCL